MRHFLEQCLYSLRQALQGIDAEVWVVDNASTDGSVDHLRPHFPEVKWVVNEKNEGFARANNKALIMSSGDHVLFLNPDTLLPEECLGKCLLFMQQVPEAGALGIRMVDGSGRFLPESKRAFPGPITSLYKLFGLSALFPRSKTFSRYYLGHLSPKKNHAVDVLAGAFMLVRREVLELTGGFDERFFMYGEDIDLSYRISRTPLPSGNGYWKNYYFSDASIIHFKGESTKKGTLNYVLLFYKAMVQFVRKHYSRGRAGLFLGLLYLAIGARAIFTFLGHMVRRIGLPLMDIIVVTASLYGVWRLWAVLVRPDVIWMPDIVQYALPAFAGVYLLSGTLAGLYSSWYSARRAWSALLLAILVVLAVYSLLPEGWRFSRGIVLLGGLIAGILMMYLRSILAHKGLLKLDDESAEVRQTLVVGSPDDLHEVHALLSPHYRQHRLMGRLSVKENEDQGSMMPVKQWLEGPDAIPVRELIFCPGPALSMSTIISYLHPSIPVRFKFHYKGSESIVGSDDSDQAGETLALQVKYNLAKPAELNRKRLVDVIVSLLLIVTMPVQWFYVDDPDIFFSNIMKVLKGKATWIGYIGSGRNLPPLRPSVLGCNGLPAKLNRTLKPTARNMLDARYARDHHYWQDLSLIRKGHRYLGTRIDQ